MTNIRAARERSGKKQSDCAAAIGVTLRAWQGYEQGIREPKFETLCAIADFFHVTTDYLLGRDTGEPDAIEQLAGEFNMTALEKKILDEYLSLPEDLRGDLMEFLRRSVQEVAAESQGQS